MRKTLLSILRSPLTGTPLHIQSALEWDSENNLKTGVLESSSGERFPVLAGIPIFMQDEQAKMTLQLIQSGLAHTAFYDLLNGQPTYWVENDNQTFQNLLYQFVGRWSADYFYYRRSDPTFLSGLSILRVAKGQAGWAFDLGCGCGHNSEVLLNLDQNNQVVGVDSTFKLLYLAKRFIAKEAEFVCTDLEKGFPFTSGQAGAVLCSDTFSFIHNKWGTAREMMRLMHPSGRLIITRLLLKPPVHWNPNRFQLFPAEEYLPMFEPLQVTKFGDAALRQEYLDAKNISNVADFTPQEQSFSLVASYSHLSQADFSPFLDPYRVEKVCLNPLYHPTEDGSWQRQWPSTTYAEDYEANSPYLAPILNQFEHPLFSLEKTGQLENMLRCRVLLSLPDRYGQVISLHNGIQETPYEKQK